MLSTINGHRARPLGLAAYPGQTDRVVPLAFDAGINYFFFYGPSHTSVINGLKQLIPTSRDDVIIACGSGSRKRDGLERVRRRFVRELGTDVLDLFVAEYLEAAIDPRAVFGPSGVLDTLARWRDEGLIRYAGASTHDVRLAARCVDDGRLDALMLRYNMAHRRLGAAVFPGARRASLPVVAFTATRWGTLLTGHPEWAESPPTAADCYRFCLAAPAVEIVLTAATTAAQLRENLRVLDAPPVASGERGRWEAYGNLVYGTGTSRFET